MALNTFKCNYLTPLHFKGLSLEYTYEHTCWLHIYLCSSCALSACCTSIPWAVRLAWKCLFPPFPAAD